MTPSLADAVRAYLDAFDAHDLLAAEHEDHQELADECETCGRLNELDVAAFRARVEMRAALEATEAAR